MNDITNKLVKVQDFICPFNIINMSLRCENFLKYLGRQSQLMKDLDQRLSKHQAGVKHNHIPEQNSEMKHVQNSSALLQ